MSPLPGQDITFRDPGLGLVELASTTFFALGTSEKGTLNVVTPVTSPAMVVDTFGEGPLSELLASMVDIAGGPVYACRVAGSIAGATGAVTKTAQSTSTGTVAAAGAAFRAYDVIVEITTTGTLGAGAFRYSLDAGLSYTEALTIPSGGTYAIPRTNVTLTFTAGAGPLFLEKGDRFTFSTTGPHYGATEVAAAFDALRTYFAQTPDFTLDGIVLAGRNATGSAAATIFGALSVQLLSLESIYRYVGAIMDAGTGDTRANVKTAMAAVSDRRITVVYGDAQMASSKPFAGCASPRVPLVNAVAARCARLLPSTDPARFADGSLPGVLSISHDEFVTEDLDAAKITTARTYPGTSGFYLTNARIKSPPGSDFLYWQHRRVLDVAARTTVAAQQEFIGVELRTGPTGALEEAEALRIEGKVKAALQMALAEPKNASGRTGHVSAYAYTVDRVSNVLSSQIVRSSVAVQPLAYAKRLSTEIGFALNVGA